MINSILFYLFASLVVFSAFRVITAKNPVYSVLFLIFAFFNSACLWLMINAEFLALALIVIYVGAVMVLFLYVVMMLDIDIETLRVGFWKNLPLAILLGVVVLIEMIVVLLKKPLLLTSTTVIANDNISNSNYLGYVLYTDYSFVVELASIILLLGLVAVIAMTLRKTNKNSKYQDISKQLSANPEDRLHMVNITKDDNGNIHINQVNKIKGDAK
jgi:NADH-quinone oxidoreductase subunit J